MAQSVKIILTSDLDGGNADETVNFALDGKSYEIDLSTEQAAELRESLEEYIKAARRVSAAGTARGGNRRSAGSTTSKEEMVRMREWAKEQPDLEVSDRGRLSQTVVEAYQNAHK